MSWDVVVIGSGYGGAVMAARLSEHAKVLLVERGRRWHTGEFPNSLTGFVSARHSRGNPLGLWSMRFGAGTGNAYVSGLGGASLVNYGITSRPDDQVFEGWPLTGADLDPHFARARQMLRPSENPVADELSDKAFLDRMEPGRRVDLENTIDWRHCTQCGCCMPGCNVPQAKLSLDVTYLGLAVRNGTEIRTKTEVIECRPRSDHGWELVLRQTDGTRTETIEANRVVLAAGTFGTLDFLHRHERSLPTTESLGQGMGMNGDSLAFLYNTPDPLSGHHGAPISTSVRVPFVDEQGRTRTLMIMSGRLPAILMRPSGVLLSLLAGAVQGERMGPHAGDPLRGRLVRRLRDLLVGRGDSGLERTFMYKLDAEDSSQGRAVFDDQGRSAIDWPDYAQDPILRFAGERLEAWAQQVGGTVVRNLGSWPLLRSFGVHPLGGCRIGTGPNTGVVDARCRLYRPDGTAYPGLRIVDASVLPASLGVPPSLTVAAIAERIAQDMIREL